MATTLATLQKKIEKLQAQASKLKARDAVGVIERIKTAIAHYDLKPEDLFGSVSAPAAAKQTKAKTQTKAAPLAKPKAATKKPASKIKFRDEQGRTWTGHGKRPRWYVEAIDSGKTPDDLLAKD